MSITNEYFSGATQLDFFWAMCGKQLGQGMSREVYECKLDPTLVVKFETGSGFFQNVMEWEVWKEVEQTAYAKWFAPCTYISSTGIVLLQKKTKPIRSPSGYPDLMPAFLGDFKYRNYGRYKGHICAHDYGCTRIMTAGLTAKTSKADWVKDLDS